MAEPSDANLLPLNEATAMPKTGLPAKREPIKVTLTAALIDSLNFDHWPVSPVQFDGKKLVTEPTPPHVKDWTVRDLTTRGLGVRVTAGAKSFFVQRKQRGSTSTRWVLHDQHSLQAARAQAADWYVRMGKVEDPRNLLKDKAQALADLRLAKKMTFERAYEEFIGDGYVRVDNLTLRPATLTDRKQVLRWMRKMDLWTTPLVDVDVALVDKTFAPLFAQAEKARRAHRETGGPKKRGGGAGSDVAAVHKCLANCNTAWNEATTQKAAANPFSAWRVAQRKSRKLPAVGRRTTMLATTSDQGVAWLKGLVELCQLKDPALAMVADYVLLSVLWGGRKTEGSLIRWRDVGFGDREVCFSAKNTKGNKNHYIPLTPWSLDILRDRRAKNLQAGWAVEDANLVFPYPHSASGRIEDYRPITRLLFERTGLWIGLHDLRRTLAGSVFGSVKDLGTVAIALGHATGQDVTMGYLQRQVALAALRELYVIREKTLRKVVDLDAPAPEDQALSDAQRTMVDLMRGMIKQVGLDALSPEKLVQLLAA
ncbi:MAG TPA: tyrosine-type recombinase/integrase [Rhodanobacter sp.]